MISTGRSGRKNRTREESPHITLRGWPITSFEWVLPHTRGATFFLYRLSELALQCPFDSENGRGKTGLKCTQACSVIVSFSTLHFSVLYFILCEFSVLFQFSLVLRPAGSITAFQHHVARSLRRFNLNLLRLFFCRFSALWFIALASFSAPYSSVFLFSALWFFEDLFTVTSARALCGL